MLRYPLAIFRVLLFFLLTATVTTGIQFYTFITGYKVKKGIRGRQIWARSLEKTLGIEAAVTGTPPKGAYILVPNHRSYIDGALILPYSPCVPVIKADVASWPLIGYAGKLTGSIFVKRGNKSSLQQTREQIGKFLLNGIPVAVFAEGTTFGYPGMGELKLGAFQLAIEHGVPIVPAAIEYKHISDAWAGKEGFLHHFLRTFGKATTSVKMRIGKPITAPTPAELRRETQAWIERNLAEMAEGWVVK
jgi:1-acyl-sn-glycerol-3-phosphate acyltransferase